MKKIRGYIGIIKTELLICIAVPIVIAVLTGVVINTSITPGADVYYTAMMGFYCVFVYSLIKMFFKLKRDRQALKNENPEDLEKTELLIKPKSVDYRIFIFITAIILPLAGLALNNNFDYGVDGGLLGDFTSIWFYIIAVLNGLIMLIDVKGNKLSLLIFYLKIAGFTYITYFAVIFIPVIPIGFIALIFYSLGVLAFIPTIVLITELFQILRDFAVLKERFMLQIIIPIIVLGAVTIPSVLTVNFLIDKANLNDAMTYINLDFVDVSFQKMPAIDTARLKATINHMGSTLDSRSEDIDIFSRGTNIPIISKIYQSFAFDGKILSPDTIQKLNQIFFKLSEEDLLDPDANLLDKAELTDISTTTKFDEKLGIYKTWIDLKLKNNSDEDLAEYKTSFSLPDGCFIKDYYLYVGKNKKQGILTDKRAALITYDNIVRTKQDPGIIYYKSDNTIELKVFPFDEGEVRKTGFLVWHSQNELISIDGQNINLSAEKSVNEPIKMKGITFVPASYKEKLDLYERKPEYYFIIDASKNSPIKEHCRKVTDYINNTDIFDLSETNIRVYAASYKLYDLGNINYSKQLSENPKIEPYTFVSLTAPCEGGFNLPFAMEMIFNNMQEGRYPVIIVVSDNIDMAPIFQKNNMAKQFPESKYYYNLGYDLSLTPYSFLDNQKQNMVKEPVISKALNYNGKAVAAEKRSEIIIDKDFDYTSCGYVDNEYQNAFILCGKSLINNEDHKTQTELIRDSFRQRILTKNTAFTVFETRKQERELLELQDKFLNGNDNDSPAVMMDEPGILICLLIVLLIVLYKNRRSLSSVK